MPLASLVKLQEAASLLATGDRLDTLVTRERYGKRLGLVQVQRQENVDAGLRSTEAATTKYVLDETAEREAIQVALRGRRRLF